MAKGNGKVIRTRTEQNPLYWNGERDAELIRAARSCTNTEEIVEQLSASHVFDGANVTAGKARLRAATLRKIGVDVPRLGQGRYRPDTAALNALLEA